MLDFAVTTDGAPQTKGTRWLASHSGAGPVSPVVRQTVPLSDGDGSHRGLCQTRILKEIPAIYYDRFSAEAESGLWAHFVWPTVAESAGAGAASVRITLGIHRRKVRAQARAFKLIGSEIELDCCFIPGR